MGEILRLQIPRACGEDWGKMEKREEGRHCRHCQKTVVDFTGMTDEEVFTYFEKMGFLGICGRFLPGQVGRDLRPAPVQRNGWSGWKWLVASALMLIRPPEGGKPVRPVVTERTVGQKPQVKEFLVESDGMIVHAKIIKKRQPRFVRAMGWKPTLLKAEEIKSLEVPVVAQGMDVEVNARHFAVGVDGYLGGVSAGVRIDTNILSKVVANTIASVTSVFRKEDFLTLYPNPVGRGEALHLAWLVRAMEVRGHGQVDTWVLPAVLAAGVYVLRIEKAGGSGVDTREILVR